MITGLSHATFFVLDQDSAYDFYVNKLGFEVRTDARMDNGFRWLTVGPKTQPGMEIVLMATTPSPMLDEATSERLRSLIREGKMGAGVFATTDCQKTDEELKERGVHFKQPPTDRFYGVEALFSDDSGNWFSLTQQKM